MFSPSAVIYIGSSLFFLFSQCLLSFLWSIFVKGFHDAFFFLTLKFVFYFHMKTFAVQNTRRICFSVFTDQEFLCCNTFFLLDCFKSKDLANNIFSSSTADLFCTFQVKRETMQSECVFRLNLPIGFTWISTCKTHQDYLSVG